MAAGEALTAFARDRGLEPIGERDFRELTPALVTGGDGGVPWGVRGRLAEGLDGILCHHVGADGPRRGLQTVVVTRVAGSAAFVPALVCRDRERGGGKGPARLPAELWHSTQLESVEFNRRYLLMTLTGQDAGFVRELFSPSLVAWLSSRPPRGFSFELNQGHLAVLLPGHLDDREELAELCELAREVSVRIATEAGEEGADPDLFDERQKLRDVERGVAELDLREPPPSVMAAIASAKRVAMRKPSVLIEALGWGLGALAVLFIAVVLTGVIVSEGLIGAIAELVPTSATGTAALVVVAVLAIPAYWIGLLIARARYRWGSASLERVALEAFARGYARSRGLSLEDRWGFHAAHRELPLPGFADHVFAGDIPGGEGVRGRVLMLGDDAELRARGQETVLTADRPMAASAVMVEAETPPADGAGVGVELAEGNRLEVHGRHVVVWRPVAGNLLRTAAGSDRFCASAAASIRQALKPAGR